MTAEQLNQNEKHPADIKELKPRMRLQGKVVKAVLSGAFVDIGVGQDGWVHISQLREGPVNRVTEVVEPGDEVMVWIKKVDRRKGRINLTMIKPPELVFSDLKPGMIIKGKVTRLAPFGAFVDVGVGRDGLVHISELASGYVTNPSEIVSVGEVVEVKVLNVDHKRRQIELGMKEMPLDLDDAEQDEPLPTIMELAIKQAFDRQEGEEDIEGQKTKGGKKKASRSEQNDIIARTLRNHGS
jgi:small subunit ribosomal protein S1